ncbi:MULTISPECIES: hypothetical protein [unclassified Streptomyces]|uniref:hypothetical protein n=1 Tax=unclassified Streptomyces TaxID=2593676 RepID=UPI001163651B|nr:MULTISPECIES: hypothetical protein [unclassified Streptomyces]NMI55947.1 hypothetical protein [Streptomyces sp. RLA2-12]QDN55408.1 hypothetical protein FNV67_08850 [Streptomyces sp. S1D4-20]QDN65586.1 hypothetical protein FNV66_08445 [Streptomyces sp. S1D4-14]QDN96230.1 hypothetical protein FNV58_09585 [Streptomyces sp. RLB1-9]QDO17938.1 hypothetical protein FNV65_08035 [Streptomyces sp. S1A1-8]
MSRPVLDETWEEIVEVPFRPVSEETKLRQWNWKKCWELGLEVRDYRVRYSAIGMDAGRRKNVREDDEPQTCDRYLLRPARTGTAAQADQPCSRVLARLRHFARGLTAGTDRLLNAR